MRLTNAIAFAVRNIAVIRISVFMLDFSFPGFFVRVERICLHSFQKKNAAEIAKSAGQHRKDEAEVRGFGVSGMQDTLGSPGGEGAATWLSGRAEQTKAATRLDAAADCEVLPTWLFGFTDCRRRDPSSPESRCVLFLRYSLRFSRDRGSPCRVSRHDEEDCAPIVLDDEVLG